MICKYCGRRNDDSFKFCIQCGRSIECEEPTSAPIDLTKPTDAPAKNVTASVRFNPDEPNTPSVQYDYDTEQATAAAQVNVAAREADLTQYDPDSIRYDPDTGERIIMGASKASEALSTSATSTQDTAPLAVDSSISHTIPTGMTMNNPNYHTGSPLPNQNTSYSSPINPENGGRNDANLHVGTTNPSEFVNAEKPIQPTAGVDMTGYVPPKPEQKEFKVFSTGHLVVCVVIITVLAVACGIFASLFFTTRARYDKLAQQYGDTVAQYEQIIDNMKE